MSYRFSHSGLRSAMLSTAALIGLAAMPSVAHADAYALAQQTIDALQLSVTGTGAGSGFTVFNFTSTASGAITAANGSNLAPPAITTSSNPSAAYSNTHNAAGVNACFVQNGAGTCVATPGALVSLGSNHPAVTNTDADLTPAGKGGATGSASYAFATSVIPDTKINTATGTPNGGGFTKQIAETNVGGGAHGTAQSGESLQQWSFTLNLDNTSDVHITYSVLLHLIADSLDANAAKTVATATTTFKLLKCTDVSATNCSDDPGANARKAPSQDNASVNANNGQKVDDNPGAQGVVVDLNPSLGAGTYEIEILLTDKVTAVTTPEPATLGLMGMGLLGLGAAIRRRSKKAA